MIKLCVCLFGFFFMLAVRNNPEETQNALHPALKIQIEVDHISVLCAVLIGTVLKNIIK